MPADVLELWQRVAICRTFPAYKLSDLDDEPALPLLRALKLIEIATDTLRAKGG